MVWTHLSATASGVGPWDDGDSGSQTGGQWARETRRGCGARSVTWRSNGQISRAPRPEATGGSSGERAREWFGRVVERRVGRGSGWIGCGAPCAGAALVAKTGHAARTHGTMASRGFRHQPQRSSSQAGLGEYKRLLGWDAALFFALLSAWATALDWYSNDDI
uniref:Uncharacterized protein n=1 Tax=Oryza nivara TaxID=4536 RepID=A0A0E0HJW2_ORYNI